MLASLMTDKCTIYRSAEIVTSWGETRHERTLVGTFPCRISQLGLSDAQRPDPVERINYAAKLFAPANADIRQGDEVRVERNGNATVYYAGEAFRYATHAEIMLRRQDWA